MDRISGLAGNSLNRRRKVNTVKTETLPTSRLAELIDQKYEVLAQLCDLARRQLDLITNGEIAPLLNLLSAKQNLLVLIQQIERELNPFRSQDPDARIWSAHKDRQRTSHVAGRCEALFSELLLLEKQSETDLAARRDETAKRLQSAADAGKARQAYLPTSSAGRSQLDVSQ